MNIYAIYDKTTGKIVRIESNNFDDMLHGLQQNEAYLEGDYDVNDVIDVNTKTKKDYQTATILDIRENIKKSDNILDDVISRTDAVLFGSKTVEQYRIDNYATLRSLAYPPQEDMLDAQAKLSSSDPTIQAEGQAQLNKYYADCLAVKERFPKE